MNENQKIGASISRELLVFKKDHLKPTQLKRRLNFYNKLLKYLTGIISRNENMFFLIFNLYLNNKSIPIIKLNKELFKECFFPI